MRLSVIILGDFENDPLECFEIPKQRQRQTVVAKSLPLEVGLQQNLLGHLSPPL
jgi:hypothetical protein